MESESAIGNNVDLVEKEDPSMESESAIGNDVDLVEHQFLVSKLTSIITQLEADCSKQNMVLKIVINLPKKLKDLKQALSSSSDVTNNIPKKESLYRINNVLMDLISNKFSLFSLPHFTSEIAALKNELLPRPAQNNHNPPANTTRAITDPDPNVTTTRAITDPDPNATTTRAITDPNSNPKPIDRTRVCPERIPDSNVHGFDDKIRSMLRMLCLRRENDVGQFRAVGVSGIRGVGKTMLIQQVFNHQIVSCFLPRIWVRLSRKEEEDKQDHRKVVVKRMLKALGVEEDVINFAETKQNLEGLLYVLRLQLLGKNYLIVLDDASWKEEDEEEFFSGLDKDENLSQKLAYGLPKGCGGAVVVTSRWQEMVNFMVGRDRTHFLSSTLDSESCWLIFKEEAEKDGCAISEELEALKEEIIKKCNGLPLAAKLLGQFARESLKNEKPN